MEGSLIPARDIRGLNGVEKIVQVPLHRFEEFRKFFHQHAAAEVFGIVRYDFNPQDPIAFVIDLQSELPKVKLEHRQVISRSFDHFLQPGWRSPLCSSIRAILPAKDGLESLQIQRPPRPVQQLLVHLVESTAAMEQQVAALLDLIERILIPESGTLLLL